MAPITQTKGEPPQKASQTLKTADDNEQPDSSNVNFKLSLEQAHQFRLYCKLIGKTQVEVFTEACQMHRKAYASELEAARNLI